MPVVAVAPIGDAPPAPVLALEPALQEAFACEVVLAPRLPLPAAAYDPGRRQHLSTVLLDALAAAKRPGWERLLGVADIDLYVPELNFVFGEGDRQRAVAVFSLARLRAGPVADELFARRAVTEAIHELGHTFGLAHCRDPRCVMWFSNTLAESDRKGRGFCAPHRAALARTLRRPRS